ncbi:MAG: methyltransferase domain-containing protein [Acidobacteria bacterium]|nr:methyltransferase domain-containing protein [Acidobacteriota bacterium]
MAGSNGDPKLAELQDLITAIRDRVRERHPDPETGADVRLPDLMPVLHARDAAQGKVASIGRVNPRAGGLVNGLVQFVKRMVARGLNWHVREQVEFNRAMVQAVQAILDALEENNRALRDLASRDAPVQRRIAELRAEFAPVREEVADTRAHWIAWRAEWERKISVNEVQFLRGLADLQGAFQHRATLMESNFRDMVASQHRDFTGALDRSGHEIQQRLWEDLDKIRLRYEAVIHNELRLVRQRAALLAGPAVHAPTPTVAQPVEIDWLKFAEKFRGPEEHVKRGQQFYAQRFRGRNNVLDLGCGRGEFLELMRGEGVAARGVDQSEELVALCRRKGLEAQMADLFEHLSAVPSGSLDGIFCSQVVEHLPPHAVLELVRLAHQKLAPGGLLAVETPNPECLAIFATHFYLDPTHTRPVPPPLLEFYFEESGFGAIETHRFAPAAESMPAVNDLPESMRKAFFGSLDYAVLGVRLR